MGPEIWLKAISMSHRWVWLMNEGNEPSNMFDSASIYVSCKLDENDGRVPVKRFSLASKKLRYGLLENEGRVPVI